MKKIIFLFFICFATFGQNITIVYPTPQATIDNAIINAHFTSSDASGPFTAKLYKSVSYQFQYSNCTLPNSLIEIVSNTGNATSISLALPSGLEVSGFTTGYIQCGQYSYNNYYKSVSYYIVVSNASVQSSSYVVAVSAATVGASIKSMSLSPSKICQNGTLSVDFQYQGINVGNTFSIEISDQNGSFNSPLVSSTLAGNSATSTNLIIPANAPTSNLYTIRVRSSDPVASFQTGLAIGVVTPSLSGNSSICENSVLNIYTATNTYSPESIYTFNWKKDNININANNQSISSDATSEYYTRNAAQSSDAGSYTLQITRNSDACASATSPPLVVNVNTAPAAPTTSGVTVISGNTASLTASGCLGTVYWYNSITANENNYITSGTYTTPELTQQTTYYAACRQNTGSYCYSTKTPLVVSINATNAPNAPILMASDNNFCQGSAVNPKLIATGCSGTVRWYSKYTSDSYFSLDETDIQVPYERSINIYNSKIYSADCRENNILSTTKTEILITVKPIPSSPNISPSSASVNNGSTLTLVASNCSGIVKWFSDNTINTILFTGNTYTTPPLVNNDPLDNVVYYYIYYSCTVDDCESSRGNRSFYVYNSLISPSFSYSENTSTLCSGNTKTIDANGCSNGIVNWYDASSNGNLLYTGQTFTTPILTYNSNGNNSYYYYANCTIGGNTSSRNSANIYVQKQPTTPTANQPTIACNSTATLTATGCNSNAPDYFSVYWYANATTTNYLGSSATFITPTLSATTTYFVECRYSDCKSVRVPITVTVGCTAPDAPVIASNLTSVCAGIGVNLSASGCSGTVNWSDGGSGTSRTNVVFNATIILTATCTVGLTSGSSNSISITITPKPILVITNPAAVAPPTTVNITIAGITIGSTLPSGTILSYHTDVNGTNTLQNPTTISVSNTYYIKASTTEGCIDIKPVQVTINDCSTAIVLVSTADDYSLGTQLKKTNETITARNKVTEVSKVTYSSNKSILLDTGFKAQPSASGYFKTEIGGCN